MSWQYVKLSRLKRVRRQEYEHNRWVILRAMKLDRLERKLGLMRRAVFIRRRVMHQMQLRDLRMSYLYGKPKR